MRDIKPKSSKEMFGGPMTSNEKMYPGISLGLDVLPEAKKWDVGQEYIVTLKLRQTGMHQSRHGRGSAEFDIIGVEVGKKEAKQVDGVKVRTAGRERYPRK